MSPAELLFAPATELARRVRDREISALELVQAHLARISAVNPLLNAVVTRCDERALERAAEADAALARGTTPGPLHGVPMTVKDAFDTAGVRSTAATAGRAAYVPECSATAVARLEAAGAILIGKTNTPELTLLYDTDNLLFGPTHNPLRSDALAGGQQWRIGGDTGRGRVGAGAR